MEEEFIYPSDEELAASFVDDLFNAFMVEIKRYPVLSIEEQKALAIRLRNDDTSVRDILFNHNLRLVVYVASAYKNRIKHLKIMDIIQEGCIGLLKAIDKYEPEKGAFSTYAIHWIRQAITRAIDDTDEEIRKPVHVSFKIRKYRHILSEAERNHTPIPDDDELMAILECSEDALAVIKEKAFEKVVSSQTKVGDEDDSELGDFIADTRDDFDEVIDNLNDQELLAVIKNKLNPLEYYFLYNYEIDKKSDDATLQGLANDFNVTRERVRQIKKKAYDKSSKVVKNRKLRQIEARRIESNLGIPITKINVKPFDVDSIVLYTIVKKQVTELEERILANLLFGEIKTDNEYLANYFGISKEKLEKLLKDIQIKITDCFKNHKSFDEEKMKIIRMYGTKIFMLIPKDEIKENLMKKVELKEQEMTAHTERRKKLTNNRDIPKTDDIKEVTTSEKETSTSVEEKIFDVFQDTDINNHELLVVIKEKLSNLEYYIFYYLLTNKDNMDNAINNLAKLFNSNRDKILSYRNKIKKKFKNLFAKKEFLATEIQIIKDKYNTDIQNIRINPLDPSKIILMSYVQGNLSDIENKLLRYTTYRSTIEFREEDLKTIGLTKEEAHVMMVDINRKIENLCSDTDKFEKFRKNVLISYGTKIFNRNFDKENIDIDYNALKKFDALSFEEVVGLYGESWNQLDVNSQNLLRRYFTIPKDDFKAKETWEIHFFLELENISPHDRELHLSPSVLYDCYLENKDSFSPIAQKFLECFVFETCDKSEYNKKYSRQYVASYKSILLDKLEKLYFNVYNILNSFGFTKEQWMKVLEKHEDQFSENRIMAMNMFYGIDGEAMSIPEIAEVFGVERDKMHDYLAKTRKKAISLYINRSSLKEVDEEIYIPYILNKAYPFTDINREILKMYLIQELSYQEIKEELKEKNVELNLSQISNVVTDALRKIDFYRFGIVEIDLYSANFIKNFIHEYKDKLSAQEKQLIKDKYLNYIDNDTLEKKLDLDKEGLRKKIQKINKLINTFKIRDVILTEEDYLEEFNTYYVERVVNEEQMRLLSYYHGIKCQYNPEGKILSISEMIQNLPEYNGEKVSNIFRRIQRADEVIKLKKKKILHNDSIIMPTDDVIKIMNDPHLPITDKEKFIICSIYGINNHPLKSFDELSKIYGEGKDSIRRRYQRAFVAIFKYKNGEIPAKIDYDYDILPLMSYFSKYDRMLIEDSYKNGLSYEKIAKKYKLTFNQIVIRFNRLNLELFEMINYPKKVYFDFDFFEKAIQDPLLPFYGNLEEAVNIFNLYFANTQVKNMSGNEIINELKLNRDDSSIHNTIYQLIIAVCRYKKGIRKEHTYSIEDVKDYYMRHKDEMTPSQEKLYLTYFRRYLKEDSHRNRELITKYILKDIIKDRYPEYCKIGSENHDEVVDLIKHMHFSSKVLNSLLNKIGETERLIMSGQELNHVYRLLNRLDKSVTLDNKQRLAKTQ